MAVILGPVPSGTPSTSRQAYASALAEEPFAQGWEARQVCKAILAAADHWYEPASRSLGEISHADESIDSIKPQIPAWAIQVTRPLWSGAGAAITAFLALFFIVTGRHYAVFNAVFAACLCIVLLILELALMPKRI